MKLNKALLMLLLSMFISTGVFASSQDIKITIDGTELYTDVAPQIINNRTLVPIRAIFESIGGEVEWNNNTQTAIGTKGSEKIKLQLGNKRASINGREFILDAPVTSVNGRTLVPVRFVAESLGSGVYWDNDTRTVVIETSATDERNFRFNKEKGEIIDYRHDGPKHIVIPETIDGVAVTSIGHSAFNGRGLTSVIIPKSVTIIGSMAFNDNKLTSVIIPDEVTSMGYNTFSNNKLTSITIPKGVTGIGEQAFFINRLTSVIIPEGVTSIMFWAFSANNLTSVTIPTGVTDLDYSAFDPDVEIIRKI